MTRRAVDRFRPTLEQFAAKQADFGRFHAVTLRNVTVFAKNSGRKTVGVTLNSPHLGGEQDVILSTEFAPKMGLFRRQNWLALRGQSTPLTHP